MKKINRKLLALVAVVAIVSCSLYLQLRGETTHITSYLANFLFAHNLHEVAPQRFYRSAQMARADLQEIIRKHQIKTVIDLRLDEDTPDENNLTESAASSQAGAVYHHIPLTSRSRNQHDQILHLLSLYRSAATPILVHCSDGTHRSGIAATLWQLEIEHKPLATSLEQISTKYGFFQWERNLKALWQGHPTLDQLL